MQVGWLGKGYLGHHPVAFYVLHWGLITPSASLVPLCVGEWLPISTHSILAPINIYQDLFTLHELAPLLHHWPYKPHPIL